MDSIKRICQKCGDPFDTIGNDDVCSKCIKALDDELKKLLFTLPFTNSATQDFVFEKIESFISRRLDLAPAIFIIKSVMNHTAVPSYILKIQRVPNIRSVEESFETEYNALKYLNSLNNIKKTIPSPYFAGKILDRAIIIESFIEGMTMNDALWTAKSKSEIENHINIAIDWLCKLFKDEKNKMISEHANERKKIVSQDFAVFNNAFPQYADQFRDYFSPDNYPLSHFESCSQHGDFFVSNLIISNDDKLNGVTDFEEFNRFGIPMLDINQFMVTYASSIKRMNKDKSIDLGSWYLSLVEDCMLRYSALIKTSNDNAEIFFRYYLLHSVCRWISNKRNNLEMAHYEIKKILHKPKNIIEMIKIELKGNQ